MHCDTVNLIYFSPTRTTQRILQGIAQGMPVGRIDHLFLPLVWKKLNLRVRRQKKSFIFLPELKKLIMKRMFGLSTHLPKFLAVILTKAKIQSFR
jgi:hypothetical protein